MVLISMDNLPYPEAGEPEPSDPSPASQADVAAPAARPAAGTAASPAASARVGYHRPMKERDLMLMANGYRAAAVLTAAAEAGLFDVLAQGPADTRTAAEAAGTDPEATDRLLRALAALDVVEVSGGLFALPAPAAALLTSGSPHTLIHILRHNLRLMANWSRLPEVLREGGPLPRQRRSPEEQREFLLAMDDLARRRAETVMARLPLRDRTHLLDVGGGGGRYALEAVRSHPHLRATVLDLPESEPFFREIRSQAAPSQAERLSFLAVDVLEGPLPAADAAFVSSLVHVFGPTELRRLAGHLAATLEPGGLLAIRDFLFADRSHTAPVQTALFAINMLLHTPQGGCYTAGELQELFSPAGFGQWRIQELEPGTGLLTGRLEAAR